MKKLISNIKGAIAISLVIAISIIYSCKPKGSDIKYTVGTFPDTVLAITDINSAYDDYNSNLPMLGAGGIIHFSSNRLTSGGTFDITQGGFQFLFVQTNGDFFVNSGLTTDPFYTHLLTAVNTANNEYGPYSVFSSSDGYDFFSVTTESTGGDLDIKYIKHLPYFGGQLPAIDGPYDATVINSASDDSYLCFDFPITRAYFSSDRSGNNEISYVTRPAETKVHDWLISAPAVATVVDSLSNPAEDKCPFVFKNYLIFTSNRSGGEGGYDLYYSVFKGGKWSAPVNFGPQINSPYDEYRPILGTHPEFTNHFLIFSSNRPGGKGGFDLYMAGVDMPVVVPQTIK